MSSVVQPGTVLLTSAALREHCEALMRALGVSAHDAQQTVDVFLQAELMGEQSHGLRLFLQVLSRLKAGGDRAATEIEVVMDRGAVALWDAQPRPRLQQPALWSGRSRKPAVTGLATSPFGTGIPSRLPSTIRSWRLASA